MTDRYRCGRERRSTYSKSVHNYEK